MASLPVLNSCHTWLMVCHSNALLFSCLMVGHSDALLVGLYVLISSYACLMTCHGDVLVTSLPTRGYSMVYGVPMSTRGSAFLLSSLSMMAISDRQTNSDVFHHKD